MAPCIWLGQLMLRTSVTESDTSAEEFRFLCLHTTLASLHLAGYLAHLQSYARVPLLAP